LDNSWRVESQRVLYGAEVNRLGLATRHFRVDLDFATRGGLDAAERLELLQIYDHPTFRDRHGLRPQQFEVLPSLQSSEPTVAPESRSSRPTDWSPFMTRACDAPSLVGDRKVASVVEREDGQPVFLLNQHVASWVDAFQLETRELRVYYLRALSDEGCESAIPTIADEQDVPWHISAGPIEAIRDLWNWFGVEPLDSAIGRELLAETDLRPESLLEHPYVNYCGRCRVATEVTAGLSVSQTRRLLQHSVLVDSPGPPATEATRKRVDLAYEAVKKLRQDPIVLAAIATGSVAMNRCLQDSDLDLVIVTHDTHTSRHIEAEELDGIAADLDWMPRQDALEIVDPDEPAGVKELREAARLAFGLPVYDPQNLVAELRERAMMMRPDQEEVRERLATVFDTLADLAARHDTDGERSWEVCFERSTTTLRSSRCCFSP
jgi:predicted nucleotidyltransferase